MDQDNIEDNTEDKTEVVHEVFDKETEALVKIAKIAYDAGLILEIKMGWNNMYVPCELDCETNREFKRGFEYLDIDMDHMDQIVVTRTIEVSDEDSPISTG